MPNFPFPKIFAQPTPVAHAIDKLNVKKAPGADNSSHAQRTLSERDSMVD